MPRHSKALLLALCAASFLALPALAEAHNPFCNHVRATIARGKANNVIRGTRHHDVIQAGEGNDIVIGRGGNDRICGGPGRDLLIGDGAAFGGGNARGHGDDVFFANKGRDLIVGDSYTKSGHARGGGNDVLNGDFGTDTLVGDSYTRTGRATGSGHDLLHGLWGDDFLYGDNWAASTSATIRGGARDILSAASGNDHLWGGPGHDICNGAGGRDGGAKCGWSKSVEFHWSPATPRQLR